MGAKEFTDAPVQGAFVPAHELRFIQHMAFHCLKQFGPPRAGGHRKLRAQGKEPKMVVMGAVPGRRQGTGITGFLQCIKTLGSQDGIFDQLARMQPLGQCSGIG